MNISTDVIGQISDLAASLGYQAATSGQASAYEQIYLAKFVHEHWADFAGKFDHLIDLDYSFLGLDLASTPSSLLSSFPHGGWPMWGVLLLPVISAGIQVLMTLVTMNSSGNAANGQTKVMMLMMTLTTLWMGYILPAALGVYWIANSGFSLIQELTLNKYFNKILDREETEKEREKRERRYEKMKAAQQNYDRQRAEMSGGKKPQIPRAGRGVGAPARPGPHSVGAVGPSAPPARACLASASRPALARLRLCPRWCGSACARPARRSGPARLRRPAAESRAGSAPLSPAAPVRGKSYY